jgi:hypothetical protein
MKTKKIVKKLGGVKEVVVEETPKLQLEKDSVIVEWEGTTQEGGFEKSVRKFSLADHGKDFAKLATGFITKQKGKGFVVGFYKK